MATNVDSLDIQISASVTKANASLDSLVNRLGKVSSSLSAVNSRGLATMGSGINKLSNAMSNFNANTKTADFTRLAKNFQQLANVDSSKLVATSSALSGMASSLGQLNSASSNVASIAELVKNINKFGNASALKAMENMPKLATSLNQMMRTLSNAPKVSNNLINMTNALANFARTGASGGSAANSLARGLNNYSTSSSRATKHSFSLASAFGKMYATYFLLFRAFGKIGQSMDYASQLVEVQNVVDNTFGTYIGKLDAIVENSIEQLGMSELMVKKVASTYQAMGKAMGFAQDDMADMSVSLTKLTADMASFYDVEQQAVAEDLQSIFTGQTKPLRQYGLDLTETTLKEWALANGMDANIKAMSQMEKAQLRYAYVMANTKTAQGDFAKTSQTWANQIRILKQNFIELGNVIGRSFIAALRPMVVALNSIMGVIIQFATLVSNALGKIFGWQFENPSGGGITADMESAEDASAGLADNTGSAADNAARLKKQLQGIDELNVLSSNDNNSGGGSGSGGGNAGSRSQEAWTTTETIFDYFQSNIQDLETLGSTIRDKLIDVMNSIDWDSVYEKARGFGTGLADFLNGLFASNENGQTLFGQLARTIAGSLNTALNFFDSFFTTFDFTQFGRSLSDAVNNFFRTFDWHLAASALNHLVDGLEDAIGGFLQNLSWSDIISGIGTFLNELELDTVTVIIGAFLWKYAGREIVANALSSLLRTRIQTGIGDGTISVGASIGLLLTAAYVGWKIGSWLYENNNMVYEASEAIAQWITRDGTEVSVPRLLAVTGVGLLFSFTAAALASVIGDAIAVAAGSGLLVSLASSIRILGLRFSIGATGLLATLAEWVEGVAIPTIANFFSSTLPGMLAADATLSASTVIPLAAEFLVVFSISYKIFDQLYQANEAFQLTTDFIVGQLLAPFDRENARETAFNLAVYIDDRTNGFLSGIGNKTMEIIALARFGTENVLTWFLDKIKSGANIVQEIKGKVISQTSNWLTWFISKIQSNANIVKDIKGKVLSQTNNWLTWFISKIHSNSNIIKELKARLTSSNSNWLTWFIQKINNGSNITKGISARLTSSANNWLTWLVEKIANNRIISKGISIALTWATNANATLKWLFEKLKSGASIAANVITSIGRNADGGIYQNGQWRPIQQFAGGGMPNGSQLFWAREAGPELVGTVGGHTAVMNNNQIVASVADGVAMAVRVANAEQNSLLRQQNEYLSAILEKETGISYKEIFNAARKGNQEHIALTGNSAF